MVTRALGLLLVVAAACVKPQPPVPAPQPTPAIVHAESPDQEYGCVPAGYAWAVGGAGRQTYCFQCLDDGRYKQIPCPD